MRARPIAIKSRPAISVARSKPPKPKRRAIGERMTTKAAVGPETWTRDPPRRAMSAPATIAV
jgi:hypothetical protein